MLWLNHRQIRWGLGVDAKIPDIAIHALFAQKFSNCILAGLKRSLRSEFDPALGELLGGSRNHFLLLAALAIQRSLDCADDALVALDMRMNNAESVPVEFQAFGVLVFSCLGASVHVDVDRRQGRMQLNFGTGAGKLDGVFGSRDGIDYAMQDIVCGVTIDFAAGLIEGQQLGL